MNEDKARLAGAAFDQLIVFGTTGRDCAAAERVDDDYVNKRYGIGANEPVGVQEALERTVSVGESALEVKPASSPDRRIKQDVPERHDVCQVISAGFTTDADEP